MDLLDSLEDAIRIHCADALREHAAEDPDSLDTRSLVADYAAWRARFPAARPRSVHESDVLLGSSLRARYSTGLEAIRRDIAAGIDLTRYLSSRVRFPDTRDLLLAHSGIHHLHMSEVMEQWRVERTEHVLFVAFRPAGAYLIDIYAHEPDGANWAEQKILETIVRNWPDAGILMPSEFATGLREEHDDSARSALRRAGVNLAVEIDGRVWSSLGATLNGAPLEAARIGMKVAAELYSRREAGEAELLRGLAEAVPEHVVQRADWEATVHDDHYGFYADRVGTFVRFGRLVLP